MFWNSFSRSDLPEKSVAFRRVHEQWLTRALASGNDLPHIPLRRVCDGGFDHLRTHPGARARADQWWAAAFERLEPQRPRRTRR